MANYNHNGVYIDLSFYHTTYPAMYYCSIDGKPFKPMYANVIMEILEKRGAPIPGHFTDLKTKPDPIDPDANPLCVKRYLAYF
jgi:hypothetical protein